MPFIIHRLSDDIHDATHCAVAIARRRRAANHINVVDHLRGNPTGVATRIAIAAPAIAYRIATGHRLTIDQDQRILWSHTADIDLPVIPALAAGRVAGEVPPG